MKFSSETCTQLELSTQSSCSRAPLYEWWYIFYRYIVGVSLQPQVSIVSQENHISVQTYWWICNVRKILRLPKTFLIVSILNLNFSDIHRSMTAMNHSSGVTLILLVTHCVHTLMNVRIRAVTGQPSSPELSFANETKMFFRAKNNGKKKVTGPWNIGHCDVNLFWGQRLYYTDPFPKVWHSSIKYY